MIKSTQNSPTANESIDDESTPMITPSEIMKYLFCPRFIFFMNCLNIPQHEELRYKVLKGREIHQNREHANINYLRKKLGCKGKEISVYLASKEIGVRGIVDEILYLSDETLAPLDYKYAKHSDFLFKTHKVQSCLYALLIIKNFKKPVKRGYLCYTRSNYKLKEIIYKKEDFNYAETVIREIFDIILKGYYPRKTHNSNRCIDCCYKNICV